MAANKINTVLLQKLKEYLILPGHDFLIITYIKCVGYYYP